MRRALVFLRKTQEESGCWIGRWGVNYIYGTWQVLCGLRSIGFDMQDPMVRRAVAWLRASAAAGGGWGETCRSYDDPTLAGTGDADGVADRLGAARPDGRRRGTTATRSAVASITY